MSRWLKQALHDQKLCSDPLPRDAFEEWTSKLSALRTLGPGLRIQIADAMVFAVQQCKYSYHIINLLVQSIVTDDMIIALRDAYHERRAVIASPNNQTGLGEKILVECEEKSMVPFQRMLARLFLLNDILLNSDVPAHSGDARPAHLAKAAGMLLLGLFERIGILLVAVHASDPSRDGNNNTGGHAQVELEKGSPLAELVGWLRIAWQAWCHAGVIEVDSAARMAEQYGFLISSPPSLAAASTSAVCSSTSNSASRVRND